MKFASKASLAVVISSSMVAVTACGNGSAGANNNSNGTSSASKKPVTVTFMSWGGAQENKQLLGLIKKINQQHQGQFQIKDINVPSKYSQKLNTELAAGTATDIFYVNNDNLPKYEKNGTLLNLDSYLAKYKSKYIVANPSNYYKSSLLNAKYNGHYYSLPWIAQPVVMYYNPKMFQAHNLPMPKAGWTWSQFFHDAKVLTNAKKHIYGFLQSNGWPPVEMYVWSQGGHFYNQGLTKSSLSQPAAVKGIQLLAQMRKDQVIPPLAQLANVNIESLYRQGRVAMFAGGAADGNYNSQGFTAKIAPMPKGSQNATFLYLANLAINAHTKKNKDVVFQAYAALLKAINHWKVVPPVKQYAKNLSQISVPDAPGGHTPQDRIPVILQSMKYARAPRLTPTNYYTILSNDIYQPILSGSTTPQKAAQKAAKALDKAIQGK
ncbi:sugar ABC transporter substrate-binding protein [Alicyclobacillus sp. SO9]|uniref:ABC transporter substrate-binding protein n=1 Tax=Alicyclobacillus sp. SO9 TaxID=2665646 RepID=UPI0018E8539E|nr:sugar ABC transporter substrate-binding protein [Alicyclobacillus sp. SO9]QQE77738.1 sugar ABC transporter substrate-binding protein [Alicyclobacillus sp. SO9]